SDYPASAGWSLAYTLINASSKITLTSVGSGDSFTVNAASADTAAWSAGTYAWRAQVSKAGEVYTVGEGQLTVRPAFSAATLDTRSHARKALSAIEAYLENASNLAASEYQIAGRQLRRFPLPELMAMRDRYRGEVAREDAAARLAAGLPDQRRIFVRFGA
ncbi:MAG: hypothetical protein RL758_337, partial [Pseudomonadota bacterium]